MVGFCTTVVVPHDRYQPHRARHSAAVIRWIETNVGQNCSRNVAYKCTTLVLSEAILSILLVGSFAYFDKNKVLKKKHSILGKRRNSIPIPFPFYSHSILSRKTGTNTRLLQFRTGSSATLVGAATTVSELTVNDAQLSGRRGALVARSRTLINPYCISFAQETRRRLKRDDTLWTRYQ